MSTDEAKLHDGGERLLARAALSLVAGFFIAFAVALVSDHLPAVISTILNLPVALYCYLISALETPPADDIPLAEFGRDVHCYFVGMVLNFLWYALLVFLTWQLAGRRLSRPRETKTRTGSGVTE